MFSKFATLVVVTLGALSASAIEYSCNSGPVQCCETVQNPADYDCNAIAALVGVDVSAITGQLGLECNAITGIGLGDGANCDSSPVCCEQQYMNQLIGVNCSPATIGA